MKTIRILGLAALSLAAACADGGVTEPTATPAGPSQVTVPPAACVTFGPMPPAWTVWGVPAAHVPGTLVHTENSIDVSVESFFFNGAWVFRQARLEPAAAIGWGTLNSLRMNYISTKYHFMNYGGWVPTTVKFLYQDLGAVENLAVNGALYVGNIAGAPPVLGGANVTVGPGWVAITGAPIIDVVIGGEDFRVDDVCAAP